MECLLASIKELHQNHRRYWARAEEDLLFELKTEDWSMKNIAELLPGRTVASCYVKWNDMKKRDERVCQQCLISGKARGSGG